MSHEQGLRERKKQELRTKVSQVAGRLFSERGFDGVTVKDIAEAVGVSEKTIFNHFPTKEDIVLSGRAAVEHELLEAIRTRARGTSILDAVRGHTHAVAHRMAAFPVERRRRFGQILMGAPSVARRMFEMSYRLEHELGALIATETGEEPGDPTCWALAGVLGRLSHLAYCGVAKQSEGRVLTEAQVDEVIDRAFDRVAAGLGDLGR